MQAMKYASIRKNWFGTSSKELLKQTRRPKSSSFLSQVCTPSWHRHQDQGRQRSCRANFNFAFIQFLKNYTETEKKLLRQILGEKIPRSNDGASDRAWFGLNPGTNLAFSAQYCCQSILTRRQNFSKEQVRKNKKTKRGLVRPIF